MDPLIIMGFLLTKHLVFDFFLQSPFQYLNKGTYGHTGGIVHATMHGFWSFLLLTSIALYLDVRSAIPFIWILCLAEGIIHYHMDWFKMWWCKRQNYKPHTDLGCNLKQAHWFWWWMGIDQYVHLMCYLGMTWVMMKLLSI